MTRRRSMNGRTKQRKLTMALLTAFAVLAALSSPASATPQGYIEDQIGIGYFYGTFDESPNVILLAGGSAEEFCDFEGEPGSAPGRIFLRDDGSVDLKVNDKDQPIFLYHSEFDGAPAWLAQVCADYFAGNPTPSPFASGTADLKIRISVVSEDFVEIFNSVNGKAMAADGTRYTVRAWADLVVDENGPVGDPADFVGFELKQVGR